MKNFQHVLKFLLFVFVITMVDTAWSTPPNVVLSDFNRNTAGGEGTLFFTGTGFNNTGFGFRTLLANGAGAYNSGFGANALLRNNTGGKNTAVGDSALRSNTTGIGNTALGFQALPNNAVGNFNLALGVNAGSALTAGSNNVYLSNIGVTAESASIRIGNSTHARAFIGGIRGKKTGLNNAVPVVIDSNGQLGTVNSSARYKKDIKDMQEASQNLMKLRPVTYRYKQIDDSGENPLEYGLIAEEVAKVYPDLVAYGADGQIETVQYQKLTPMLLNEVQRLNTQLKSERQANKQLADDVARMNSQVQQVAVLKAQVEALQSQAEAMQVLASRLSRLEAKQTSAYMDRSLLVGVYGNQ